MDQRRQERVLMNKREDTAKALFGPLWPASVKPLVLALAGIRRHRRIFGVWPNLLHPTTFNEHCLHGLLFNRDPRLTLLADKVQVRQLVAERLGGTEHLTTHYVVLERADQLASVRLPTQFVMKANHMSQEVKIVHDATKLRPGELERLAARWLPRNFYYHLGEWCYKDIPPRLILEELLDDGGIPQDYKLFCFGGEPRFVQIDRDRFTGHLRNLYELPSLTRLPMRLTYPNFETPMTWAANFGRMVEIARTLSAGWPFLRVDLYNLRGGELSLGSWRIIPRQRRGASSRHPGM